MGMTYTQVVAKRVDWFRVLDDIKREDVSLYALADQTGIEKTVFIRMKSGSEPKHHDGETIIDAWSKITGRHRSEIPLTSLLLSAAKAK